MSATTSSSTNALALSGLASGINWTSIVNEMLAEQAAPETQMNAEETADNNRDTGYEAIGTDLATLNTDATTLSNPAFFGSRTTSVFDSSIASATAAAGTALGNYTFSVGSLASNSVQIGSTASAPLSPTSNVSSLVLSSAGFATPVTAGTFTVNGQTITITTGETLQSVFDQINTVTTAAGDPVTASYDATGPTDEITLSSSKPITLGSDTDTSNFLQVTQLYNNGLDTVTSAGPLGGVNLSATLNNANLSVPLTTDGSGNGQFLINGVSISYNASTDTVSDVLDEINNSAAGVTATYDSANNRFELTDDSTGDVGIAMQDVTGNFLAASGLSGGTLQAGTNLTYSINGGGALTSQSNTIDAGASGVTGLSLTALGLGTTTISVASDTSTISSAINSFVSDYNAVQNYISSQTVTTTSTTGTVTPGLFTGDMDVENIAFSLRQMVDATPPGGTSGVENLNDLGIESNGTDNTLAISNTAALDNALTNNLSAIQNLFTNPTNGLATTLGSYIGNVTASNGTLPTDEANASKEAKSEAASITTLQAQIAANGTELDNQFANMETAIESINTDKELLNDYFSSSSSSTSNQSAPTAAGSNLSSSGA
jgi:flagellar hook-associated protein 2